MSPPAPRLVLITGATGEIGGALALEYAGPGRELLLQGRRSQRLEALAAQCRARGAQVHTQALDLRDRQALEHWLQAVCAQHLPDLLIVCAGLNTHARQPGSPEPWDEVQALLEVNLRAAMAITQALIPPMARRGHGQVALISSLAAYFGLPLAPAYCASKAGLKAYGEALRGAWAAQGVRVNVVMPGYVRSPMCDAMPGPKPQLWPAARAARAIRLGLARNRARIGFPFPLSWGCWWLAVLPAAISTRILRWLGYGA
ncbi:MAG: SDR family NAD(P)-dependent oxidoreductase [Comamonadaceae bacterium]|nr:SDR family NAD(P)-dependent oxidoreductase [Comamonadaceae bacterium]